MDKNYQANSAIGYQANEKMMDRVSDYQQAKDDLEKAILHLGDRLATLGHALSPVSAQSYPSPPSTAVPSNPESSVPAIIHTNALKGIVYSHIQAVDEMLQRLAI